MDNYDKLKQVLYEIDSESWKMYDEIVLLSRLNQKMYDLLDRISGTVDKVFVPEIIKILNECDMVKK